MAAGWQTGGVCHASLELAGATACANAFGVTGSGLLSCTSVSVVGSGLELVMSSGSTVALIPQPCERITYADTWGPLFGVILVSTVVIWGLTQLIAPFRTGHDI